MEETETPHPDYLKGFNEGYLMSKHLPDLAEKISPALKDSDRAIGFKDGRQESLLEKRREKYPAWRRSDWLDKPADPASPDKSKDLDKDLDAPEPEID